MKKFVLFVLLLSCLLALTVAYAQSNAIGGVSTLADDVFYSFAWSAERYEQSAALPEKADLHLTLCRNEWEAFQLLVKTAVPEQPVTVEITPFINAAGDSFAATVYQVGYEAGEDGGSYPQSLTVMDGAPIPLTTGLITSFWMELQCPADAPTGDYAATVILKDANGATLLEQNVTATVYSFRMFSPMQVVQYIEDSAAKKMKLPALTGSNTKTFLGYAGNSYDYFRLALEFFGEDWLNEHFDNVVADFEQYKDDVAFFAAARPKLAKALSADMSEIKEASNSLQFHEDGSFRILVMSDIHQACKFTGVYFDEIHAAWFRAAIEKANPALIVLLGDNMHSEDISAPKMDDYIRDVMSVFEECGMPVTLVFGNHEDEDYAKFSIPKTLQLAIFQTYDCFIGEAGPDLPGLANHNLPILSSDGRRTAFNLWFLDSGTYYDGDPSVSTYPCVEPEQIAWYVETSNALKAANGGEAVPSMVFQHIPVPEIYDALIPMDNEIGWALPEGASGGLVGGVGAPGYNTGEFTAFVQQGDVIATVHGHDHLNSFIVNYQGIDIINTPICARLNNYFDDNEIGVRVIDLNESDLWRYETYIIKPADAGLSLIPE